MTESSLPKNERNTIYSKKKKNNKILAVHEKHLAFSSHFFVYFKLYKELKKDEIRN